MVVNTSNYSLQHQQNILKLFDWSMKTFFKNNFFTYFTFAMFLYLYDVCKYSLKYKSNEIGFYNFFINEFLSKIRNYHCLFIISYIHHNLLEKRCLLPKSLQQDYYFLLIAQDQFCYIYNIYTKVDLKHFTPEN